MARVAARLDEDEAAQMLQTAGKVGTLIKPTAHPLRLKLLTQPI